MHFVRHAEGYHNQAIREAGEDTPTVYSTPGSDKFLDARLNPVGKQQCLAVRQELEQAVPKIRPKLVVVSPLTRTLETAHIVFGDMKHRAPFIVHDACRERWGKYVNDRRRSGSEITAEFGELYGASGDEIDFRSFGFASDIDNKWTEERESDESCAARAIELLAWLSKRKEREIAVVTHSSFLRHLFAAFGSNLSKEARTTLQRSAGNAEVRTIVLASHRGIED